MRDERGSRRYNIRSFGLAALVVAAMGCGAARYQPEEDDDAPTLVRLSPDSVFVAPGSVVAVTLIGTGFQHGSSSENTVHFGRSVMRGVSANYDGTRIAFVVPDAVDSGGEAPPVRVITGSYPVQVETAFGKSNVLMLKVVR